MGQRGKLYPIKEESTVWRLEAESDRHVACQLYGEYLIREALAEVGDFKIGRRVINFRFANDTAIVANTQEELQDMVNRLVDTGRKYGM